MSFLSGGSLGGLGPFGVQGSRILGLGLGFLGLQRSRFQDFKARNN